MADNDQEKTEEPTGKRINESHAKGQFAKSQEISTTMIISVVFGVLAFSGRDKATLIADFTRNTFSHLADYELTMESATKGIRETLSTIWLILLPLLIGVSVAAVMAGGLQSGFKLTPKALESKIEKLDPIKGAKKLFNKQNFVQLLVDMAKFAAMFSILYGLVRGIMNDPIFSAPVPVEYVPEFLYKLFMQMLSRLLVALSAIAAIDYFWQRYKTHEDMKMTKQEVRDEMKSAEGDPQVKGQRKRFGMKLLQQQMSKAVPHADVIVTNPTHFAVALKYEQGKDKAPVVVAKGEGRFAKRIKEIAREHGVPMVENKPVARLLFKTSAVGKPIPIELYQIVAQILAHVYRTHRYYFHRLKARRLAVAS